MPRINSCPPGAFSYTRGGEVPPQTKISRDIQPPSSPQIAQPSLVRKWTLLAQSPKANAVCAVAGAALLALGLSFATGGIADIAFIVAGAALLTKGLAYPLFQRMLARSEPVKAETEALAKTLLQPEVVALDNPGDAITEEQVKEQADNDKNLIGRINKEQLAKLESQLKEALKVEQSEFITFAMIEWKETVSKMTEKGEVLSDFVIEQVVIKLKGQYARLCERYQRHRERLLKLQNQKLVPTLLEFVKQGIEEGKIVLADQVIRKAIADRIASLDDNYRTIFLQKLREQVNTMFLRRAMSTRTAFLASNDEVDMLRTLGYDLAAYQEKDLVHAIVAERLLKLQTEAGSFKHSSLSDLRKQLEEEAFIERLAILQESSPDKARNLMHALKAWNILKEHGKTCMTDALGRVSRRLDEIPGMDQSKKALFATAKRACNSLLTQKVGAYFREKQSIIRGKLSLSLCNYETEIKSVISDFQTEEKSRELAKSFDTRARQTAFCRWKYLKRWASDFSVNLIQGLDNDGKDLGDGVCYGYSHRVGAVDQHHPSAEDDTHLNAGTITAKDRILQCIQTCNEAGLRHLLKRDYSDPNKDLAGARVLSQQHTRQVHEAMAKKTGFKKVEIFPIISSQDPDANGEKRAALVGDALEAEVRRLSDAGTLEASAGVVHLTLKLESEEKLKLGYHSVYIRYDTKRGLYRYVDANFGVFTLRVDPNSDPASTQKKFFEFFQDTMRTTYWDLKEITPHQMI